MIYQHSCRLLPRSLIVLIVLGIVFFPPPKSTAQEDIAVTILCDPIFNVVQTHPPDPFPGVYYGVLAGQQGNNDPWMFQEITASGVREVQAPFSPSQASQVGIPSLSPDGLRMAFRPFLGSNDLTVWDIATGEVATLTLSSDEARYIQYNFRWLDQYVQKVVWNGPDRLLIHVFDEEVMGIRVLRTIEITVSSNPLRLRRSGDYPVTYPVFPIPEDSDGLYSAYISPQRHYVLWLTYAKEYLTGLHLQLYDLESGHLVFDFPPTDLGTAEPPYALAWSPNERFLLFNIERFDESGYVARRYVEVDLAQGFMADTSLEQALVNTFGYQVDVGASFPVWSPDGRDIAFGIYGTSQGERYIVAYTPETRKLTAICDKNNRVSLDTFQMIWSPDSRYVGYWDFGKVIIFDLQTGEVYRLPNVNLNYFVGWSKRRSPGLGGAVSP